MTWFRITIVAALAVFAGACGTSDDRQFIAIGTGAVTGVYYPVGGAIATLIDQDPSSNLTASVESTGGSVFNINAVLIGDLDFGITQSDKQYQAFHGEAEWADAGPQERLRAVCSLHTEMVTLVASADSGIASLEDLKGKRVNIGNPGSGHRGNAIDIFAAAGIDWETDLTAESIKAAEASKMLQDERIDAFFYTVGHPNGSISEATAGRRKVRFVPIEPDAAFWERHPYYSKAVIPAKYYENAMVDGDVATIGMPTTLVTSADVADDVVYEVTKIIFEHLDALRAQHPALADLTAEAMLEGSSAPIHPGAMRYYREAGLKP
jgi:TRAP transporter TAXI family solute receptor